MAREFRSVGIVGVGTTGAAVAVAAAAAGLDVVGVEVDEAGASRAQERVGALVAGRVRAGDLDDDGASALLGRVRIGTSLGDLAQAELVLETVPEDAVLKARVLGDVVAATGPEVVLATGTTALAVTPLGVAAGRPDRLVGWHWTLGPEQGGAGAGLVEVVRTPLADAAAVEEAADLATQLGRTPLVCGDRPGLVAERLVLPYLNDAVKMYEAGYATREDVDAAMRFGCGYPVGPLALVDALGVDTVRDALDALHAATGETRAAPAPLLSQLVTAGLLGRKAGRGFYTYAAPGSDEVVPDAASAEAGGSSEGARPVSRIGVVGTGTMATGIAEVCAKSGYDVVVRARSDAKADGVRASVEKSLGKQVSKGRMTEEQSSEVLGRLHTTADLADLADCDLVVEAVVEDLEVKRDLFRALDEVCKQGAVLATTTSSLPVVQCAMATSRPSDVVGMHWFNPAQVMKLVELVPTVHTAPEVLATVRSVCERTRKHPVECGDRAGFIVNALLFPFLNDAARTVEAHYADLDEVDAAVTAGYGHPMGPFALIDVVGLDVTLAIQQTLHADFRDPGLAPSPVLGHLAAAGFLGRKTGRGFRAYARR